VENTTTNSNGNIHPQSSPSKKTKCRPKGRHRRHLSSDINHHLSANHTGGLATPERTNNFRKTFAFHDNDDDNERENGTTEENGIGRETDSASSFSSSGDDENDNSNEVQQLSCLLQLFVQLKESAGVERAILSSLLAFRNCPTMQRQDDDNNRSNTTLPSLRMLTNDLILEVENQRALCHKLDQLPSGPHHSLVLELAELSPRLKELQQIILTDFSSLRGAEYDSTKIWDLITQYIDKLHSVELLIIEDLDLACAEIKPTETNRSSLSSSSDENGKVGQGVSIDMTVVYRALKQIGSANNNNDDHGCTTSHELLADIKNMAAEKLKDRVLALLASNRCTEGLSKNASKSNSKSIVNVPSTAAEILNEDMNKALHKQLERAPSKEWEISIYEIKFQKRLGQGASATTYLGKWTGQNVAVKVASITEFGLEGWRTEVNALQRLHHPNIIRLMGSIYNENPQTHCLVLEYCNGGDLGTALRYPTPRNFFFHVSSSIANAMSYLHKRGILHRDLKPSNVLIHGNVASGKFDVKITDFGIATDISRVDGLDASKESSETSGKSKTRLTGETGTYRWMAPEVIRHESYSSPADVYSFAIMLWQFVTHDEPFCDVTSVDAAKLVAVEKKRPPLPRKTPELVVQLIKSNWTDEPEKRWNFEQIAEGVQRLQESLPQEDRDWLDDPDGHSVYGVCDVDEMEPILHEVFASQPSPRDVGNREKCSSRGRLLRRNSPGQRGVSPSIKKPSLLSSFFRKTSFDHGKI
jgi:mitogen-activated protein kinase kinase kinase 11